MNFIYGGLAVYLGSLSVWSMEFKGSLPHGGGGQILTLTSQNEISFWGARWKKERQGTNHVIILQTVLIDQINCVKKQ